MDTEAQILRKVRPRRVRPAGLRYNLLSPLTRGFYRDLDPDRDTGLDLERLGDLAIQTETDRIVRAVEGLPRVLVVGVNAAWPALRVARRVRDLAVVHPDAEEVRLARKIARNKWNLPDVRFVRGETTRLPLEGGSVDCVVSDSALASWEAPETISAEIFRVLTRGGLLVAREVNWAFEMRGEPLAEEWTFKRLRGEIYFGYTKRTLDPPREVEYICLMDQDHLWVKNLRALPREALKTVSSEDCPGPADLLVSAEYFEIRQMTAGALGGLLVGAGFEVPEVEGSGLEVAVREHLARVGLKSEGAGSAHPAESLRAWESLAAGRSPFLLATAVKPL